MNELELLVLLADHRQKCPPTNISTIFSALLGAVGATSSTSRQLVPDVLPAPAALQVLRQIQALPQTISNDALLPLITVSQQGGFGSHPVASLDLVVAFSAFLCSGRLGEVLHVVFWVLDRDGQGQLTLQQVMKTVGPVLMVAALARLILGVPLVPPGNSSSGAVRQLLEAAVQRAYTEQDPSGHNGITEQQLQPLVFSTVSHLASSLVEHASAARSLHHIQSRGSRPQSQPSITHTTSSSAMHTAPGLQTNQNSTSGLAGIMHMPYASFSHSSSTPSDGVKLLEGGSPAIRSPRQTGSDSEALLDPRNAITDRVNPEQANHESRTILLTAHHKSFPTQASITSPLTHGVLSTPSPEAAHSAITVIPPSPNQPQAPYSPPDSGRTTIIHPTPRDLRNMDNTAHMLFGASPPSTGPGQQLTHSVSHPDGLHDLHIAGKSSFMMAAALIPPDLVSIQEPDRLSNPRASAMSRASSEPLRSSAVRLSIEHAADEAEIIANTQADRQDKRTISGRRSRLLSAGGNTPVSSSQKQMQHVSLRATIQNSVQEAGVRIFLNCGICLLSVISLLLADAALIAYIYLGQKLTLHASLGIVALVDVGVVLVLIAVVIIRAWVAANQRAALSDSAGGHQRQSSTGVLGFVATQFLGPLAQLFGGGLPPAAAPRSSMVGSDAPVTKPPGSSTLQRVWMTIGKLAGFTEGNSLPTFTQGAVTSAADLGPDGHLPLSPVASPGQGGMQNGDPAVATYAGSVDLEVGTTSAGRHESGGGGVAARQRARGGGVTSTLARLSTNTRVKSAYPDI